MADDDLIERLSGNAPSIPAMRDAACEITTLRRQLNACEAMLASERVGTSVPGDITASYNATDSGVDALGSIIPP